MIFVSKLADMGRTVIVIYRPPEGKGEELRKLVRDHVPILQRLGLATSKPFKMLRRLTDTCSIFLSGNGRGSTPGS